MASIHHLVCDLFVEDGAIAFLDDLAADLSTSLHMWHLDHIWSGRRARRGGAAMSTACVIAYFDGLCEPKNPGGLACGGWWVEPLPDCAGLQDGLEGCAAFGSGPGATNNTAEYRAALACLTAIAEAGSTGPVELRGDSRLLVEQYNGRWACNAPALAALLAHLRHAARSFASVTVTWIPREQNARADALSRQAYQDTLTRGRARP
jgi:ribonuclease HI